MSWEELGIQDPGIRWRGPYKDWHSNGLGELYEMTSDEIEDIRYEIEDYKELGLYLGQLDDFGDWLDYVDALLDEAISGIDFRTGLIRARVELIKLRRQFDSFCIGIDWFGV